MILQVPDIFEFLVVKKVLVLEYGGIGWLSLDSCLMYLGVHFVKSAPVYNSDKKPSFWFLPLFNIGMCHNTLHDKLRTSWMEIKPLFKLAASVSDGIICCTFLQTSYVLSELILSSHVGVWIRGWVIGSWGLVLVVLWNCFILFLSASDTIY